MFKGGTSLSKVWRVIQRFSEDIDISLSREWLGFSGERDPEQAKGKQRKRLLAQLSAACATRLQGEVMPSLRRPMEEQMRGRWLLEQD
ncbi:MAG: nucleotidyl transferase AbiEii/AbiGii toxin family protein, partial [Spartobacteria bacterium]|nr:nucleotidyl transferase AbiEii/AbiGii toxin family protein [Spartobacteria bacterium]